MRKMIAARLKHGRQGSFSSPDRSVPPAILVDLGSKAVRYARRFALGRPIAARAGHAGIAAGAARWTTQGRPGCSSHTQP
jgi:hypothetical protein